MFMVTDIYSDGVVLKIIENLHYLPVKKKSIIIAVQ